MLVGLLKQFKDSECKDVAVLTEQVHALIRAACTAGAAPDPTLLAAFHRFLPPLYQAQAQTQAHAQAQWQPLQLQAS